MWVHMYLCGVPSLESTLISEVVQNVAPSLRWMVAVRHQYPSHEFTKLTDRRGSVSSPQNPHPRVAQLRLSPEGMNQ